MSDRLVFEVEQTPEGGCIARAIGESIVVEADDLPTLRGKIPDAVRGHFDAADQPKSVLLRFVDKKPAPRAKQPAAVPVRSDIHPGTCVSIVEKQNQPTGLRTEGIVGRLLTKSPIHPRGIKVMLTDGRVGRVQEIV